MVDVSIHPSCLYWWYMSNGLIPSCMLKHVEALVSATLPTTALCFSTVVPMQSCTSSTSTSSITAPEAIIEESRWHNIYVSSQRKYKQPISANSSKSHTEFTTVFYYFCTYQNISMYTNGHRFIVNGHSHFVQATYLLHQLLDGSSWSCFALLGRALLDSLAQKTSARERNVFV